MSGYSTWLREGNFINGQWVGADSGETIDVTNPATGDVIGTVPNAGGAETARAIDAAQAAFPDFAAMDLMSRVGQEVSQDGAGDRVVLDDQHPGHVTPPVPRCWRILTGSGPSPHFFEPMAQCCRRTQWNGGALDPLSCLRL